MGHHNSKSATTKKSLLPTDTLSPLERAVLNKNISEARKQLTDVDDVNQTGKFGLSLLHLAIISTTYTADLEHCYKYYQLMDNSYKYYQLMDNRYNKIATVRQMVAILAGRGAVLVPSFDKINPLEAVYYCSLTNKPLVDRLTGMLFNLIQFSITDITRYTVWKLVCGTFNLQFNSDQCRRRHRYHLMAQFVKHGIMADDYFSGLTDPSECLTPFQHCHEFRQVIMVSTNSKIRKTKSRPETGSSLYSFHHVEFMINVWYRIWEFNDPRDLFLDSLKEYFLEHFAHDQRTKLLAEKYISLWLTQQRHDSQSTYRMVSFLSRIFRIITEHIGVEELRTEVGDFALFKRFISVLPDTILSIRDMYNQIQSVDAFIMLCFNMYQLLVKSFRSPGDIPYYEVDVLSESINKVLSHLPTEYHGSYSNSTIYRYTYGYSLDEELFAFLARFDPNINVRNSDTGRTPIQQALLYGNIYKVHTLLESGANPFTVDREGNSFVNQLDSIIRSLRRGPAKDVYEDVKNKYVILNKPYPLVTIASNVIVNERVPFDVLKRQPRLYHMLLHYLPPD